MVANSENDLDLAFHALSDRTRRSMLNRLVRGECSVSELAEPFDLTLAGVSKHLKVLEQARLVEKVKEGRTIRCKANLRSLEPVTALLEELGEFWRGQLDSLERFLMNEETKREETKWHSKRKPKRRKR